MCLKCYSFYAIILRGGSIFVRPNQDEIHNSVLLKNSLQLVHPDE